MSGGLASLVVPVVTLEASGRRSAGQRADHSVPPTNAGPVVENGGPLDDIHLAPVSTGAGLPPALWRSKDPAVTGGIEVVGLEEHDPRIKADLYPLLRQLRPGLSAPSFDALILEGYAQGLRYIVAYGRDGTSRAAAGYRLLATSRGRILFLDDLVTRPDARSGGIGATVLEAVGAIARGAGATAIELDSGVTNAAAHRFYFTHRMQVSAFHFSSPLTDPR